MEDLSLSKEQRALKESIEGGAALAGIACGLIAALVIWLLTRNGYPILTYVFVSLTLPATYWVASVVYTALKTEDAKCKACGAVFSVAHVGREESLVAATPRKQEHAHRCHACSNERQAKSFRTSRTGVKQNRTYRR